MPTSIPLSPAPPVANLPFQAVIYNLSPSKIFLKNVSVAYIFDGTTVTKVTDVDYPSSTVPGCVYIDQTVYVMDVAGKIYGSALSDPTNWDALNFIIANREPDQGVAIAKLVNYLVAFKQWSIQFFYDNGNSSGSPLSDYLSAFTRIGCASGLSVVDIGGTLVWIGQTLKEGRGIYMMNGISPVKISSPFIDKVLALDDLSTVYAFSLKFSGHTFYVLSLAYSNVTLMYDLETKLWGRLTFNTIAASKSISSMISDIYGTAQVMTSTAHGLSDGDPVTIAGATPTSFNGLFNISYIDTTHYSVQTTNLVVTTGTGTITSTGYIESYFPFFSATRLNGIDYLQHASNGKVYTIADGTYLDDGVPVDMQIWTAKWDGGTRDFKQMGLVELSGDTVDSKGLLRYTNDDYRTWSPYRLIDLSTERKHLTRMGAFRSRAWIYRHTANTPCRVENLEMGLED